MNILILGANGFIGSHLCEAILARKDWHIHAMDLSQEKLTHCLDHPQFHFVQGDIVEKADWVTNQIQHCDIVIPLVAIATPALYVRDALRVFEIDFEMNLEIVRQCVRYNKRVIFPSTSEVYGMCEDAEFDEEKSLLVTGPIHKERWIYSSSKQLMDRLIYAYGKHKGLSYTLIRPFNWYGPRLDNIFNPHAGSSRVLTQFIGNIIRGENIQLVNGGEQKRCFTFIDDGIDAILSIIENKNDCANNRIFNIGNPKENYSIRDLAEMLIKFISTYFPELAETARAVKLINVDGEKYYGEGYQDINHRVPSIHRARHALNWEPKVTLEMGLKKTLDFYLSEQTSSAE